MLETVIKFLFAGVSPTPFASCLAPPFAPKVMVITRALTPVGVHMAVLRHSCLLLHWSACLRDHVGFRKTLDWALG